MGDKVFKFCIHLESGQVYCGKESQDAEFNFCLLFPFFLFSISHSNVIHREICVKNFSGTTVPRIFKFRTTVEYDLLHYVREHQPPDAYHLLYLSIFLLSNQIFYSDFSASVRVRVFKFLIHLESGQAMYIVGQKTKMLKFIFTIFFHFSFLAHLSRRLTR